MRIPDHSDIVLARVESEDEVEFVKAYFDHSYQKWRDVENDNVITNVKAWRER